MAAGRATEREFTSPAGALTLLLVSGWTGRETTLRRLERSRHSGLGVLIEWRSGESPVDHRQRFVAATLERWLLDCPDGPLDFSGPGTKAIAAMTCCWSTAVTHALAEEPRTLAELDQEVASVYDEDMVREHAEALVRTGQAEVLQGDGVGEPRYALTEWGMEAIAPLIAAAAYEARFPQEDVLPPEVLDAEAAFQLSVPLLKLPGELHGTCRLSVCLPGDEPALAGTSVEVAGGRVVSSSILLESDPETWATGTALQWCEAIMDPSAAAELEVGGDVALAGALLTALHERLFSGVSAR